MIYHWGHPPDFRGASPLGHELVPDRILTMIIKHACSMIIVHACSMIIVHACTMIIIHACTMIIVHACSMIIVHVSYTIGLVFLAVDAGGLGGEALQVSRRVWGAARPPNSDHITNFHFTLRN